MSKEILDRIDGYLDEGLELPMFLKKAMKGTVLHDVRTMIKDAIDTPPDGDLKKLDKAFKELQKLKGALSPTEILKVKKYFNKAKRRIEDRRKVGGIL